MIPLSDPTPRQVTGEGSSPDNPYHQTCCPDLHHPPDCGDWSSFASSELSAGNHHQPEPSSPDNDSHTDHRRHMLTALVCQPV